MLIRLLWLVLLALIVRAIVQNVSARMRGQGPPRMPSDPGPPRDIPEGDIIEAEFTELGDKPAPDPVEPDRE
jgi:hypothetical protein